MTHWPHLASMCEHLASDCDHVRVLWWVAGASVFVLAHVVSWSLVLGPWSLVYLLLV